MKNPRKDCIIINMWSTPKEFNRLTTAIENNDKEETHKILFGIWTRGDIIQG